MIGTVKSFDSDKFTGVIDCPATGEQLSFSFPSIATEHYKKLFPGQKVRFLIKQGSQNSSSKTATNVTPLD